MCVCVCVCVCVDYKGCTKSPLNSILISSYYVGIICRLLGCSEWASVLTVYCYTVKL